MNTPFFSIDYQPIPGVELRVSLTEAEDGFHDLCIKGELDKPVAVADWQLRVRPRFTPTFYYTPHLTPTEQHVIDMHVFRAPTVMMGDEQTVVCLLPVVDGVACSDTRVYLDMNAQENVMAMGVTTTCVAEHVLYHRTGRLTLPAGRFVMRARILVQQGEDVKNPFRKVLAYYWQRYGARQSEERLPAFDRLEAYVHRTYEWAFGSWKDIVWQEFDLDGQRVGAPQMIVITRQSPNYGKPVSIREPVAIWNQAWFCSLRSAQGVFRYARRHGRPDLMEKALLTKELALSFPQEDGLFDSVLVADSPLVEMDGQQYRMGADWSRPMRGNSNRNPQTWDLMKSPKHILDMSWTALHMLTWYEELEQDERLLAYVIRYARRLLQLQDAQGYFPAWLDKDTHAVLPQLRQSPESAVSVTLLVKLYTLTGEQQYLDAALRCMDVLIREVMPDSRWEDFETYWSCSPYGQDMLGKKFLRNACYKQCSLSPFYMAQALYACHQATGQEAYLEAGIRCLDELLMYQSAFQPDYMPITVVGGFGVANGDAELNDARQSMFAELILQYGDLLKREEYIQRGYSAMRASFSMMYCPENSLARVQWEKAWPFLNEKDFGFMMENYGHDGYANGDSLGIGEFTIYDWGNGAASEAVERLKDHRGV